MNITKLFALAGLCSALLITGGCKKDSSNVWDDSSSLGTYKRAKERVLWGASEGSEVAAAQTISYTKDEDFIPLQDDDLKLQFSESIFKQPKESPGEEDSSIPGIASFYEPSGALSSIFHPVYFNTDEYSLKNSESTAVLKSVAAYLKEHQKTYIFVEGHADQRGAEAYNFALASKRANSVRTLLIQHGVNPEQIYTISYGKERPANPHNNPEAWAQNRRAQFKLYNKR